MEEAARRLGVSVATIRRRLHSGELQGSQEPTSQGFKWLVEVSELATAGTASKSNSQTDSKGVSDSVSDLGGGMSSVSTANGEVGALKETIAILREELEARRREVQELHVLLQHAQAALSAPKEDHLSWWQRLWHRNGR
jgi:hypothetical protein